MSDNCSTPPASNNYTPNTTLTKADIEQIALEVVKVLQGKQPAALFAEVPGVQSKNSKDAEQCEKIADSMLSELLTHVAPPELQRHTVRMFRAKFSKHSRMVAEQLSNDGNTMRSLADNHYENANENDIE